MLYKWQIVYLLFHFMLWHVMYYIAWGYFVQWIISIDFRSSSRRFPVTLILQTGISQNTLIEQSMFNVLINQSWSHNYYASIYFSMFLFIRVGFSLKESQRGPDPIFHPLQKILVYLLPCTDSLFCASITIYLMIGCTHYTPKPWYLYTFD